MVDPRILLIAIIFAGLYYVGDVAVQTVKKIDAKVAHVARATGKKVVHLVTFGHKGDTDHDSGTNP